MKRSTIILALVAFGVISGTAFAAFVSTTSTAVNSFSTHYVTSRPTIGLARLTTDPTCGPGTPGDTIRQGAIFYACVESATDPAGITSVVADLSGIDPNPGADTRVVSTAGGPFGSYAYRSAAITATAPLATGTTDTFAVRAFNGTGDRSTKRDNAYNIRSYAGLLLGEFGGLPVPDLVQYYRLSESGPAGPNKGPGGAVDLSYEGTPTRQVPGALVGNDDTAVRLNGTTDYLRAPRLAAVTNDFTTEIWVKGSLASGAGPGAEWSDSAGLMDVGDTYGDADFGVSIDSSGRVVAGCGPASVSTIRSGTGTLNGGAWHQVAFTRVRATGAIALYIDGEPAANATSCHTDQIGGFIWYGRSHESDLYLTADLDEPAMYGRALTTAEIRDRYRVATGTG